ncbi:class I ribonucleotide reductase maintenance protein YfaE [Edaphovirga cremea]|uniref:class I ribonucleotide reductase maintenance protein YfaE n=1 Tax=Edaphovirga cremea TaxID=2267246 RepID=UPI000DEFD44E|nr:class I ribonucleotide reductase maintenance protein YfaE [Edaphovirga cremea]
MDYPIITLRTCGTQLSCNESPRSVLDVLESHNVVVEYQCREGYCGSCRMRLLKGSVVYHQKPLAFIQDGEILPCCCSPDGDIEIGLMGVSQAPS